MLFFSDFLWTQVPTGQVRIKEKVVINPQQSLQNINIIGEDSTSTSQVFDTTGTRVTVRYRRFCFDTPTGGKAFTESSPCNAYKDSAVFNQQGIAQYKFIAYDKNALTPYRIRGYPGCFSYGHDTLTVTDNRGFRRVSIGYWPLIDYQPPDPCVVNNPQPQTLAGNSIETYSENSSFSWVDETGTTQTINGIDGCSYDPPPPGMIDLGKTFIMYRVSPAPNAQPPYYKPLSDRTIDVCLDELNQNYKFRVSNIRIPIFESVCLNNAIARGWVDLGDGTNNGLLSTYIYNCDTWRIVRKKLEYFIKGTHNPNNLAPPGNFFFSPAIMMHEKRHGLDFDSVARVRFNEDAFPLIFGINAYKSDFPCAKNAIDEKKETIDNILNLFYEEARLAPINAMQADEYAQKTYQDILDRINTWAKRQTWWNNFHCNLP